MVILYRTNTLLSLYMSLQYTLYTDIYKYLAYTAVINVYTEYLTVKCVCTTHMHQVIVNCNASSWQQYGLNLHVMSEFNSTVWGSSYSMPFAIAWKSWCYFDEISMCSNGSIFNTIY